jgi:hypothetical protein
MLPPELAPAILSGRLLRILAAKHRHSPRVPNGRCTGHGFRRVARSRPSGGADSHETTRDERTLTDHRRCRDNAVSCGVGDHVFHMGLFVVRSGASSRSAIGCLIVNGKKPLNFRELAINFAHFQSHHRQQHDDAGQSHRKSDHMLNRCLHLLVLYRLAPAASTIGATFPQSNSQSLCLGGFGDQGSAVVCEVLQFCRAVRDVRIGIGASLGLGAWPWWPSSPPVRQGSW